MAEKRMNWNEFKEWVGGITDLQKDYFFRGQCDPSWKLQTTFHRLSISTGMSLRDYLDNVLPEVNRHVSAHYDEILDLNNRNTLAAFLALLQHHGFPTPLLDWTLSPYIAAFFAFRDVDKLKTTVESVKFFAFDFVAWSTDFVQPRELREEKKAYLSVLVPFAKYNPRIIPQQGRYTVTNVADIANYVGIQAANANKQYLYEMTLPVSERSKAMRELSLMGITEMTLFP